MGRVGGEMDTQTLVAATALALMVSTSASGATCKLTPLAQLPVTMQRSAPMVPAKINGKDVRFIVDSGAFYSVLSPASAEALNLPQTIAPNGFLINGVGGPTQPMIATVKSFGLAGGEVSNLEFLVAGSSFGEAVGVLGQNILSFGDLELDLGGGAIRLIRAEGCKDESKVYWTKPGEKYSSVAITPITRFESHIVGTAYLNGKKIRVLFDTGAAISILSVHAAERAGIRTSSPGVVQAGFIRGNGARLVQTWIAPFDSFRIGAEEVRGTRLRIGDLDLKEIDMLVGADFFLSHRVYVSYGANRMLFTYRGGPVFDIGQRASSEAVTGPGEVTEELRQPQDAQGFARRGAFYAARGDTTGAITDLTRAIELAPTEPDYYVQRGRLFRVGGQAQAAMSDVDRAIQLKPDHVAARIARATLKLDRLQMTGQGSTNDINADADVARAAVAPDSDLHFDLGMLYAEAGSQEQAMTEFDQWLVLHGDDSRAADARARSCRARGVLGVDLAKALADCNRAVQDRNGIPFPLEARGLVQLRLRNFPRAIADLDKVLALQPRNVWALYTRGLAKLGDGRKADGDADIAQARSLNPRVVANAVARGFVP